MSEYRVVRYYIDCFECYGYKLQKKHRFLFWTWWGTQANDTPGLHFQDWCRQYNCKCFDEKDLRDLCNYDPRNKYTNKCLTDDEAISAEADFDADMAEQEAEGVYIAEQEAMANEYLNEEPR